MLRKVFLTFDDGPNEPYTSRILDILKEFEAKATFFVCGKNVEYFPEVAQRILNEGHAIGNHAYSHSRILTFTGLLRQEIERTTEIIYKTTGVRTNFFRPPWGVVAPWIKSYLKANNYKLILWDINSYDWAKAPAPVIEEIVLRKIKPDSIILLHDGKNAMLHSNRSQTVLALSSLIKNIKQRGFICKNINERDKPEKKAPRDSGDTMLNY